jgi:hypothetical protein
VLAHPLDPVGVEDAGSRPFEPDQVVEIRVPAGASMVRRSDGPAVRMVLPAGTRLRPVLGTDGRDAFRVVLDPPPPAPPPVAPANADRAPGSPSTGAAIAALRGLLEPEPEVAGSRFAGIDAVLAGVREPGEQHTPGSGDEVREVSSYSDEWPGFLPGELPPSGATVLLDEEFERDRPLPGGTAVTVFVPSGVPVVRRSGADGLRLLLPAGTRLLVDGVRFDVGTRVVELVVLLPGDAADEGGR